MSKIEGECSRENCTGAAVFQPRLILLAGPGQVPAEMVLPMLLCEAHAVELDKLNDYMTQHGWHLIREEFIQRGFLPPRRELTTVRMVPVGPAEVH